MTRHTRRALPAIGVLALTLAQGCASPMRSSLGADHRLRDTLIEREREWAAAMRAHDMDALDTILAAEFRLTFANDPGAPPEVTRDRWLDNLSVMSFGPISMHDFEVARHSSSVATVTMGMTLEEWTVPGRTLPPHYDLTDLWVFRDGRWQVVSRTSEPMPGR